MTTTPKASGIAWHYTGARHLPAIIESGILRSHQHVTTTPLGSRAGHRPMLWFTMNQTFEPSIAPHFQDIQGWDADVKAAALEQYLQLAGGSWVRFGYPGYLLFPAGINRIAIPHPVLRPVLRDVFDDWRVSYKPIAVTDCLAIDRTDETMVWERIWTQPIAELPIFLDLSQPASLLARLASRSDRPVGQEQTSFTTTKARNAAPHP